MKRLLWITDPHLDFLPRGGSRLFAEYLEAESKFDGVVVTGDIAEALPLRSILEQFQQGAACPVYFVLGNHDYYRGSFASVRASLLDLPSELVWLDRSTPVALDDAHALTGHQGWYDAVYGNALHTDVRLRDFREIEDLANAMPASLWDVPGGRDRLIETLRELGSRAAEEARVNLLRALELRSTVIFATHYPPFREACWHEGTLSDSSWLPWFTSQAMGVMLSEVAASHPESKIEVLCGHTHSSGKYEHSANLTVWTGKSVYGSPNPTGDLVLDRTPLVKPL